MREELVGTLGKAAVHFQYEGRPVSGEPYGSGHINDTYRLILEDGTGQESPVILQRINTGIFQDPEALMGNIVRVTAHLRKKILDAGGDPMRETMQIIPARDGKAFWADGEGNYWRSYLFITGATSYDQIQVPAHFEEAGVLFGDFQGMLADFPAETLAQTIPGFHDTKKRYQSFLEAVRRDICGRAGLVQEEIRFVLERRELAEILGNLQKEGKLPLRVTHNDTKMNNILIDDATGKGLCVIDLDTVMPGLAVHDFGDSIRFGANTAAEDEPDFRLASLDLSLFELYTKGYLLGCAGRLTQEEIRHLTMGARVMTFECGMRFLTDYLSGDTYFKIHRPAQNLDRCHVQFALLRDMERKYEQMLNIVYAYA